MQDLNNLDTVTLSEKGIWWEPQNPATGEGLGMELCLAGIDSGQAKAAIKEYSRKKKAKSGDLSIDEEEELSVKMLAQCTYDWRDKETEEKFLLFRGDNLAFSIENAKLVYEALPVLRIQVSEQILNRAHFLAD